jgi:hypothetical protein
MALQNCCKHNQGPVIRPVLAVADCSSHVIDMNVEGNTQNASTLSTGKGGTILDMDEHGRKFLVAFRDNGFPSTTALPKWSYVRRGVPL